MEKLWKDVPGFCDYQVSSCGDVRVKDRVIRKKHPKTGLVADNYYKGRKMKLVTGEHGHKYVTFCVNKKRFRTQVGRVVLMAFAGPCPNGMECCHNNGISGDNRIENLRWDTHFNNNQDRVRHGTYPRGSAHPMAKLNEADARYIYQSDEMGSSLAEKFGVNKSKISDIRRGRTWKHVTGGVPIPTNQHAQKANYVLDPNKAKEIKEKLALGKTRREIADEYGVDWKVINAIYRGFTWSWVQ
jgi:hypothetical protein